MSSQKVKKYSSHKFQKYRLNSKKVLISIYTVILLIAGFSVYKILQPANRDTIAVIPTNTNIDSPFVFTYSNKAGTEIIDSVSFYNFFDYPVEVEINALDKIDSSVENEFILKEKDLEMTGIGKWIKLDSTQQITLPAGGKMEIPFSLNIPNDVKNGEYWGGISATLLSSINTTENGASIVTQVAIGARVHLTVTDNPIEIKKMGKPSIFDSYKKYILTSITITLIAIIMILLSQLKFFNKNP